MSKEVAKRLAPTTETLRELYLKSGNQCAFPDCHRVMIDDDGTFVGQVCHIEAAEKGGERFNEKQTNEERRNFANLMLMCYGHHRVTNDVEKYTVECLKQIKAAHEKKYGDIASKIRASISDHTEASIVTPAKSLLRINNVLGWKLEKEHLDDNLAEVENLAERIRKLPISTRELLVILLRRSSQPTRNYSEFGISVSELKHACDLDPVALREHLNLLDKYGITMEGNPDNFGWQECVKLCTERSGWPLMRDIRDFAEKSNISLSEIIIGLRFDLLD